MLKPFDRNAICLSADNNYMKYLYVTLQSIVDNSSMENIYDIIILSQGIELTKQQEVKKIEKSNIHITFFDMNDFLQKDSNTDFFVSGHVSLATYFRFYIPDIFVNYEKVAYIDCDLIVKDDIYNIFSFDLGENILGVVYDAEGRQFDQARIDYINNILGVNHLEYFCAGVLVYNMKKVNEFDLKKKCIDTLKKIPHPMFHDQDILNAVTYRNVCFLPLEWHVQWHVTIFNDISKQFYKENIFYKEYMKSFENIKILHYDSSAKPWNLPNNLLSHLWWEVARKTPYYEEFLHDLHLSTIPDYNQLFKDSGLFSIAYFIVNFKYKTFKILAKLAFGNFKMKIVNQKNKYKLMRKKLHHLKK